MSVSLPNTSATIASEYAATSINFNRNMLPDTNGHLVANFSANISYSRTDYVIDASGNKLNVIQRNMPMQPINGQDTYNGNIYLQSSDLASLSSIVPTTDLLDTIANTADTLIHADLIKRAILTA